MAMMKIPPLGRIGQTMGRMGRMGDNTLVHMNPQEVEGLAALGKLTYNPVTGLPEAFNFSEVIEEAVEETTKTEFSKEKASNIVKGISSMLTYLDNNESYDHILQIQNHIEQLENYGHEVESIVETARKQTNNSVNKDLYGSWVADNSTKLTANTMQQLKTEFYKKYKVAV